MEAANPLVRWCVLAGLVALTGCQSSGSSTAVNARGQAPLEPIAPAAPTPLTPVQGMAPLSPAGPLSPLQATRPVTTADPTSPVQGFPISTTAVETAPPVPGFPINPGPVARASLSVPATNGSNPLAPPNPLRVAPAEIKNSVPQVKMVAQVGTSNFVTDQEVIEAARMKMQVAELRGLVGLERTAKEKELYQVALRDLIERELLIDDFYARMKKNASKSAIEDIKEMASQTAEREIMRYRKMFGARTEQEFSDMLRADGLTLPVFRRQKEREIMAEEYVHSLMKETGRNPSFPDMRAYYDSHPEPFKIEDRVRWQDLVVSFSNHPSREAARAHAELVLKSAQSGTDFVTLIKQQEKHLSSRQNWDGIGTTRDDVPLNVAPAVWALQPGQISGLIELPDGYHIVKVLERQYAGLRPFVDNKVQAECRDRLKRQYSDAERNKLVQELWRRTAIQVFERFD